MKRNVFSMSNEEMVQFISDEVQTYKTEIGQGNSLATGYQKVQLSELQQYSKLLQRPVLFGVDGAAALKEEIDSYVSQYSATPMKREVKPLTMQDYYQQTKQYSQFAKNR